MYGGTERTTTCLKPCRLARPVDKVRPSASVLAPPKRTQLLACFKQQTQTAVVFNTTVPRFRESGAFAGFLGHAIVAERSPCCASLACSRTPQRPHVAARRRRRSASARLPRRRSARARGARTARERRAHARARGVPREAPGTSAATIPASPTNGGCAVACVLASAAGAGAAPGALAPRERERYVAILEGAPRTPWPAPSDRARMGSLGWGAHRRAQFREVQVIGLGQFRVEAALGVAAGTPLLMAEATAGPMRASDADQT